MVLFINLIIFFFFIIFADKFLLQKYSERKILLNVAR